MLIIAIYTHVIHSKTVSPVSMETLTYFHKPAVGLDLLNMFHVGIYVDDDWNRVSLNQSVIESEQRT